VLLDAGGITLSGLLAEPPDEPRAVVVGLHGGGMDARYFHGQAHPSLSLLTLGAALGFTVLSLDRPGYGASAGLEPECQTLPRQAEWIFRALDAFATEHRTGAGYFVVGHSYGLKLAFHLAAHDPGEELLGIDGSGAGVRYHPETVKRVDGSGAGQKSKMPRRRAIELFWGPEHLYPPETFHRGMRPVADLPPGESLEAPTWPDVFPKIAPRVRIPVRYTVAEFEKWWETDDVLAEVTSLLSASPRVVVAVQHDAGHNISLGWAARAYHLHALAFAEECVLDRLSGGSRARSPRRRDGLPHP